MTMQVGFETEGTAIFDTMQYVTNEVTDNHAATARSVSTSSM